MQLFLYIDDYIKSKNFKSPSTKRLYRLAIKLFENFLITNNYEIDFNGEYFTVLIEEFKNEIKDSYSKSSIISFVKVIINYFEYLESKDYIIEFYNSLSTTDNNAVDKDSIISEEEFNKLIYYLRKNNDYSELFMVYIAFYTGLKAKYLCKIKYSDFVIENNGEFNYVNKIMRIQPFKISLPLEVKDVFEILKKETIAKDDNSYIFINKIGNIYTERYLRNVFQNICQNAKINRYTPSDFRHSAVYYYIKKHGYDKEKVAMIFNWTKDNYDRMYKKLFDCI